MLPLIMSLTHSLARCLLITEKVANTAVRTNLSAHRTFSLRQPGRAAFHTYTDRAYFLCLPECIYFLFSSLELSAEIDGNRKCSSSQLASHKH